MRLSTAARYGSNQVFWSGALVGIWGVNLTGSVVSRGEEDLKVQPTESRCGPFTDSATAHCCGLKLKSALR